MREPSSAMMENTAWSDMYSAVVPQVWVEMNANTADHSTVVLFKVIRHPQPGRLARDGDIHVHWCVFSKQNIEHFQWTKRLTFFVSSIFLHSVLIQWIKFCFSSKTSLHIKLNMVSTVLYGLLRSSYCYAHSENATVAISKHSQPRETAWLFLTHLLNAKFHRFPIQGSHCQQNISA